jgi:hypothetical protein
LKLKSATATSASASLRCWRRRRPAPGDEIIEIGTFDGRTTINLAINVPDACPVFTLDLPPGDPTHFGLDTGARTFIDKPATGARFQSCAAP